MTYETLVSLLLLVIFTFMALCNVTIVSILTVRFTAVFPPVGLDAFTFRKHLVSYQIITGRQWFINMPHDEIIIQAENCQTRPITILVQCPLPFNHVIFAGGGNGGSPVTGHWPIVGPTVVKVDVGPTLAYRWQNFAVARRWPTATSGDRWAQYWASVASTGQNDD